MLTLDVFLHAGIVTTVGDDGHLHEHAAKTAVQKLRDAVADCRKECDDRPLSANSSLMESLSVLRTLTSITGGDGRLAGQATADGGKETAEAAVVAAQNGGVAAAMDVLSIAVPVTANTWEEREGGKERSSEAQSDANATDGGKTEPVVPIDAVAACSALHGLLPLLQLGGWVWRD